MSIRRFEHGSKQVLLKIEDSANKESEKSAIVMWQSIAERVDQKIEGETTQLFYQVGRYLQEYATQNQITIHFLFTTSNPKLKKWFLANYQKFGFINFRDLPDEGIIAADKYYRPEKN